jgi:hypothetical protein
MPARRRRRLSAAVQRRLRLIGTLIAAFVGVTAGVVTIASFVGLGPGTSVGPSATSVAPPSLAAMASPKTSADSSTSSTLLAITSAAIRSAGDKTVYEIHGIARGIYNPPWRIFIIAKPISAAGSTAAESDEWWVSNQVIPGLDGSWLAQVDAERFPPGSLGVTFQPVLVQSQGVLSETAVPSGFSGTFWPIASHAPSDSEVMDALSAEGPASDVVEVLFDQFQLTDS